MKAAFISTRIGFKADLVADIDYDSDLQPFVDKFTSIYARADEKHDPDDCSVADNDLMTTRGIEIGHIFYFGTKYSLAMGATVSNPDGENVAIHMGSYGIGVSRLVGGIIEANHDDKGIIWPDSVAPFGVAVVNLKPGYDVCDKACQSLYDELITVGVDPTLDDRDERPGAKLAAMDLIGIPWQIVVGPRGMENGMVEVKRRKTGETKEASPSEALELVSGSSLNNVDLRSMWKLSRSRSLIQQMFEGDKMRHFFSPVERMLAFRYVRSRRAEGFISVIAWFSLAGITLGVATLIVVMSVMNGFRAELVGRILGLNGHVAVYANGLPALQILTSLR